jgi:hypothetical protein
MFPPTINLYRDKNADDYDKQFADKCRPVLMTNSINYAFAMNDVEYLVGRETNRRIIDGILKRSSNDACSHATEGAQFRSGFRE